MVMKLSFLEIETSVKRAGGIVVYGLNQHSIKLLKLFIYSINVSVAIFVKALR